MKKGIPEKSPLPQKGSNAWKRSARYFDVGALIEWHSLDEDALCSGYVAEVKKNKYGRISYITNRGELVFMEEVKKAVELTP